MWSIGTTGHLKEVRPAGFDCNKFSQIFFFKASPRGRTGVLHKKIATATS